MGVFSALSNIRNGNQINLAVVFMALTLDNMLLTVVVPIIPNFLYYLSFGYTDSLRKCVAVNKINVAEDILDKRYPILGFTNPNRWDDFIKSYLDDTSYTVDWLNYHCVSVQTTQRAVHMQHIAAETGLLFCSKAIAQLIATPFVGPLTNAIGLGIPMFVGFVILFISTLLFAFGETYIFLLVARSIQGLGSALISTAGLGLLATVYTDDVARGAAFGIAMMGLSLGVALGPLIGGVLAEYFGKPMPFLILAILIFIVAIIQLLSCRMMRPAKHSGSSLWSLLTDPYIIIVIFALLFNRLGISILEPSLPIWMRACFHSPLWMIGLIFLPIAGMYFITVHIFGRYAHLFGRWLFGILGLIVGAIFLAIIPFVQSFGILIIPALGIGLGMSMVDAAFLPLLGGLVDMRHVPVYGSVYAIANIAFCLAFAFGPMIAGPAITAIGFKWVLWIVVIIILLFVPLNVFLKNPPRRDVQIKKSRNEAESSDTEEYTYSSNSSDDDDPHHRATITERTTTTTTNNVSASQRYREWAAGHNKSSHDSNKLPHRKIHRESSSKGRKYVDREKTSGSPISWFTSLFHGGGTLWSTETRHDEGLSDDGNYVGESEHRHRHGRGDSWGRKPATTTKSTTETYYTNEDNVIGGGRPEYSTNTTEYQRDQLRSDDTGEAGTTMLTSGDINASDLAAINASEGGIHRGQLGRSSGGQQHSRHSMEAGGARMASPPIHRHRHGEDSDSN